MKVLGPWSTRDFIHRQRKSVKVWDQERVQFDLCLWRLIQRQIYGGKNPEGKVGGGAPTFKGQRKKEEPLEEREERPEGWEENQERAGPRGLWKKRWVEEVEAGLASFKESLP